jgi:hypothetical protein
MYPRQPGVVWAASEHTATGSGDGMTEERARLQDHQGMTDLHDLAELEDHWQPCWTCRVDYKRPAAIWVATPSDGGQPITADSAAGLRAKLRLAAPVDRGPQRALTAPADWEADRLRADYGERWDISRDERGRLTAVSRDGSRAPLSGSSEGVLRSLIANAEFPELPARWAP